MTNKEKLMKDTEVMEKWTMCAPPKDKERYEENGKMLGLSRNAYIRFMTNFGEERFFKSLDVAGTGSDDDV